MRVRIWLQPLTLILIAASLEAGSVPSVQVDNKPDARIDIVPVDDAHRSLIPKSLSGLSVAPPPGSFVLVNRTGSPITAVDVTWTYTGAKGDLEHSGITCDAYMFAPLDPIVEANDLSLVTPYGCARQYLFSRLEPGAGGLAGGSPLVPKMGSLMSPGPHATIHVCLDSVIFEDGLILGPDKSQYHLQIRDRYLAVKRFVAEVEAGRSAGEDMPSLLERIRKDADSRVDMGYSKASSRRAYYAGLLLRSPNSEAALQQLKEQIAPPTFRHIGEHP